MKWFNRQLTKLTTDQIKDVMILCLAVMLGWFVFNVAPAISATWPICGSAKRITCVVDGDTIWHQGEKVRLMGFDTPEKKQHAKCKKEQVLAGKATVRLQKILSTGYMTIERHGKDRYKRTLAIVRVGGENVGLTLIREGLAYKYNGGKRDRFRWCR